MREKFPCLFLIMIILMLVCGIFKHLYILYFLPLLKTLLPNPERKKVQQYTVKAF